ncbi:hypothetical protein Tcan_03700 [Toxocara canis]|uniref:Uncharacterized protein n=1 Tax=Toxocara canis TaxID=6265 RepID=A0A0B2VI75_TOXCA|nr:hypothetical protein Tcan_03700 [Toxocara canis]
MLSFLSTRLQGNFSWVNHLAASTSQDLLKTPPFQPPERDTKMEQQCNRHHGAHFRQLDIGENIYARHRQEQKSAAEPGKNLEKRIGGRLCQVEMADGTITSFHVNQLRKCDSFEEQQNHREHQWITLLDSFGLTNPAIQCMRRT